MELPVKCTKCKGTGSIHKQGEDFSYVSTCPKCEGTGLVGGENKDERKLHA